MVRCLSALLPDLAAAGGVLGKIPTVLLSSRILLTRDCAQYTQIIRSSV